MSAVAIQRIACRSVVALIEGQELGVRAVQPRRHVNFTIADGEMNQCAVGKAEQRLGGFAFGMGIAIEASPNLDVVRLPEPSEA